MLTVTITWLDGQQETYRCQHAVVRDGVLFLDHDRFPASGEPGRRVPLAGVRLWTVDD